jgi:hypothetical protein
MPIDQRAVRRPAMRAPVGAPGRLTSQEPRAHTIERRGSGARSRASGPAG